MRFYIARADGYATTSSDSNPVSVNNSLLRVCKPGQHAGKDFACPLGNASLAGTGIEDCGPSVLLTGGGCEASNDRKDYGASAGWLSSEVAVEPAEGITLRLTIWDSGDSALDSVAIIDHVHVRLRSEPPPPEKPETTPVSPN